MMKIALLLGIVGSFYCFGQMRVEAENIKNGRKFQARFDTQEEASAWIERQKKEKSWGKLERWVRSTEVENPADCLETREKQDEIRGSFTECKLTQEFTVTVTDISAEVQVKEEKRVQREFLKSNIEKKLLTPATLTNGEISDYLRALKEEGRL